MKHYGNCRECDQDKPTSDSEEGYCEDCARRRAAHKVLGRHTWNRKGTPHEKEADELRRYDDLQDYRQNNGYL